MAPLAVVLDRRAWIFEAMAARLVVVIWDGPSPTPSAHLVLGQTRLPPLDCRHGSRLCRRFRCVDGCRLQMVRRKSRRERRCRRRVRWGITGSESAKATGETGPPIPAGRHVVCYWFRVESRRLTIVVVEDFEAAVAFAGFGVSEVVIAFVRVVEAQSVAEGWSLGWSFQSLVSESMKPVPIASAGLRV